MNRNEIYTEFEIWLNKVLEEAVIPEDTSAFNFNFYEESEEDCIYGIQIIASDQFDEDDDEWPCAEVWSSEEDIFYIDFSDEEKRDRETAYDIMKSLVCDYLENGIHRNLLTNTKAVGAGFVDGELELIYKSDKI